MPFSFRYLFFIVNLPRIFTKLMKLLGVVFAVFGLVLIFSPWFGTVITKIVQIDTEVVGLLCVMLSVAAYSILYLQSEHYYVSHKLPKSDSERNKEFDIPTILRGKPSTKAVTDAEADLHYSDDAFFNKVVDRCVSDINAEMKEKNSSRRMSESSERMVSRIISEINDLRLRTNVNLVIGMVITSISVYLLWSTVSLVDSSTLLKSMALDHQTKNDEFVKSLLLPIGPRALLIIFIELIAFFFLKLYKTGLDEIKYFQNELTNLESKFIALEVAIMEKNPTALKSAIDVLSKTERNFILTKGQSTVELERAKNESDFAKEILKYIPKIVGEKTKAKSE